MTPRVRAALAGLAALLALIAAISVDAWRRREADRHARAQRIELARASGLSDLSLSSDARWLRHPSQVEPAAAITDGPGALDLDPAGGLLRPPRVMRARGSAEVRGR